MTVAPSRSRGQLLEAYGRCYGRMRLAIGWTDGLDGLSAKRARNWQTRPFLLADADHGAALFVRGLKRNPVVSLRRSGLIGVDVDGPQGRALLAELLPAGLPDTVTVQSGRDDGGQHYWYQPPEAPPHAGWPAKIEIKNAVTTSTDGYLVIPPAIHGDTGRPYHFLPERAPWHRPIAALPASVLEVLVQRERVIDDAERADDTSPIPVGVRHRHFLRIAGAMRRVGAGEETIAAALLVENAARCQPPEDEATVRAFAHDIATRYPPGTRP